MTEIDEFFTDIPKQTSLEEEIVTPAIKKKAPYEIMNSILKKDFMPTEAEIKSINSFMLARWLSNHPGTVAVANYINNNHQMDIVQQYQIARYKVHGIKFIAQRKKAEDNDELINILSAHYQIRDELAIEYAKMLPETEIIKLLDMYKNTGRVK